VLVLLGTVPELELELELVCVLMLVDRDNR
jgi:hypothetical protein